jgi:hypothetical protein
VSRARNTGLWVLALAVVFLILAGGAALTYMAVARPAATVEAEVATGDGSMAGVQIGYSPRVPIWILIRARLDRASLQPGDLGPAQVSILVDGAPYRSLLCQRSAALYSRTFYMCSVTVPVSELGPGTHEVVVRVESVTVRGVPITVDAEAARLTVVNEGPVWYFRQIRLTPAAIQPPA